MFRKILIAAAAVASLAAVAQPASAGTKINGFSFNELKQNGWTLNGLFANGIPLNGVQPVATGATILSIELPASR